MSPRLLPAALTLFAAIACGEPGQPPAPPPAPPVKTVARLYVDSKLDIAFNWFTGQFALVTVPAYRAAAEDGDTIELAAEEWVRLRVGKEHPSRQWRKSP